MIQAAYNGAHCQTMEPNGAQRKPAPAHRPDASFLALHFAPSSFRGQFVTGKRIAGSSALQTLGTYKASRAAEALKDLRLYDGADFYITANQMTGNQHRDEAVFAFQNIVVDVDAHAERFSGDTIAAAADQLVAALRRQLGTDEELVPNTVVRTGRGLQLWWALDPLPAMKGKAGSPAFLYYALRDRILAEVNHTIAGLSFASMIFGTVDAGASANDSGLYRLPGSYNTKSRSWSRCEILHRERINVSQTVGWIERTGAGLRKDGKLYPRTAGQISAAAAKHWNVRENVRIVSVLGELRDLRRQSGKESAGNEHRNNYIYALHASLLPSLDERIVESMLEVFNEGFIHPMKPAEIRTAISWTKQHNRRGLKNKKIIELLEITPEEQDKLRFFPAGSPKAGTREAQRQQARDKKHERDEEILRLRSEGHTEQEIAQRLGCCRQTVAAVLKRSSNAPSAEERDQRILQLLQNSYSPAEIAELVGCCPATVYNVKNKAAAAQSAEAGASTPTEAQKQPQNARKIAGEQTPAEGRKATQGRTHAIKHTEERRNRSGAPASVLPFSKMLKNRRYMMLSALGGRAVLGFSGLYWGISGKDDTS